MKRRPKRRPERAPKPLGQPLIRFVRKPAAETSIAGLMRYLRPGRQRKANRKPTGAFAGLG
jgi:hypothetical protein